MRFGVLFYFLVVAFALVMAVPGGRPPQCINRDSILEVGIAVAVALVVASIYAFSAAYHGKSCETRP